MSSGFEWYVTQDEERWTLADAATREDAIAFGRVEFNGKGFMICEASKIPLDFHLNADWILDRLEQSNEEATDQEGDGLFMNKPTVAQQNELDNIIAAQIEAWAERRNLRPTSFMFAEQRGEETIPELQDEAP